MLDDRMKYIGTVPSHNIHSFMNKIINKNKSQE